jgi:AcrR family transcriptional regulator
MRADQANGLPRERLLAAALELFTGHGVGGTSLAMIGRAAGLDEAAAREHFADRDAVALAVVEPALERLAVIADEAEAHRSAAARRDAALQGVVELVTDFRRIAPIIGFDPVVVRLIRAHPAVRSLQRVRRLLGGSAPDPGSRTRLAMLSGGLIMAGADPAVATLDSEDLRGHLLSTARRILRG